MTNPTPIIQLLLDENLEDDTVRTTWTSDGYGRIKPEVPIVQTMNVKSMRQYIEQSDEQLKFYESDFHKWGRKKAGKQV